MMENSAPASTSPCTTWKSAAPAKCSATTSRARCRKSASTCSPKCSTAPSRAASQGKEPDLTQPLGITTEINLHTPALLPDDYCAGRARTADALQAPGQLRSRRGTRRDAGGTDRPLRRAAAAGAVAARQPPPAPARASRWASASSTPPPTRSRCSSARISAIRRSTRRRIIDADPERPQLQAGRTG